ncbi:helix-turn-helix domain-containing protein [Desulfofundulus thermobenzoicus]|uniref:Helix-turn-helix domain-containing protein n=1 Tax=Desulfofundulus thermobenzoicus TaxID=29376 RepID=A0A6N7ITQ0_9FIRM|nr:Crp/Fnr family transcriptional regulator [Desulfofundulus thermobenzoicus]MQL52837.1 helix-turn-helix domain-containing protein [Desulfofundulus thermobenzoicus]HHW43207.1 Crp/Fnr family transcriptional regulator [Desulfotomaculum sp.]
MGGVNLETVTLDDIEKMLIRQAGSTVHYPKGHVIFAAGDLADRVYLIESGWVKIYRLSADGRRVTVGSIRSPGELMGLAETLWGGERTCFAGAINNVTMVVLRKNKFEDLMGAHPFLAIKVAKLLGARMREAEAIIHEMVCWQAPGRLALTLLKMGERCGTETKGGIKIDLQLTHEELANMVGTSRQTVTSLLNTFKQEKSIAYEGRAINIVDPDKLARWIM